MTFFARHYPLYERLQDERTAMVSADDVYTRQPDYYTRVTNQFHRTHTRVHVRVQSRLEA